MPQLEERRIINIGNAHYVSLPPGWLRYHGLSAGDFLEVVTDGEITLRPTNPKSSERDPQEAK